MSAENAAADGGIVGNVYDKYATKNPIARALMNGFLRAVRELYMAAGPRSVLEVGCGEGRLAQELIVAQPTPERFEALDVSLDHLAEGLDPRINFVEGSVYELAYDDDAFDLVVCCEVLEHLERPQEAMKQLARVARRAVLISTPREPLWRAMNMCRGRYLRDLGNTPGHIQHFSRKSLMHLARGELVDLEVLSPIPWTVILGAPRTP